MPDIDTSNIRGSVRYNFDLKNTNWFQVGGKADILFKPDDLDDLINFLKSKPSTLPVCVLGVGSNLIIRDGGIEGAVIKLGRSFSFVSHDEEYLIAGASALDLNVSNYAAENALGGLEFLSGIPGTIGGGIKTNAGAYGREFKDVLVKAEAIDLNGNVVILNNADFNFSHRTAKLDQDYIITKVWFKYYSDAKENIAKKMKEISEQRSSSQPIKSRTGGSTFKNPANFKAWELIDKTGLRGYKIGGAQVSEKHCNFLINTGDATATDLENLGEYVRAQVFEKTGIMLEWEIKIIGRKK